ncbi:methyl-CpG-binding domain-containing protein 5 [Capsicum annuum]|uniref:methyl-CpG-binding domain-containing protein 5 n=1 Tax=Capsicum annuum TaxID=4072 RepID=UPI001FB0CCCB|nr:methyl-CpG-binding domain-containing protein 5 [Capsicum annuum]
MALLLELWIGILQYYYEPVLATRFRSKPEVLYFLETGGKRKKSTGGDATPSETPSSKKQKKSSSKKEKKETAFSVDSSNPPESVSWLLTDSSADTLTRFIHGKMVPEGQRQEWDAVFLTVSQRNANRDAGVSNVC